MKTITLLLAVGLVAFTPFVGRTAETVNTENKKESKCKIIIRKDFAETDSLESKNDTTKIRIGKKIIEIINKDDKFVQVNRVDEEKNKKFKGHWAGIDLGINGFNNVNYNGYVNTDFMELSQYRSLEVNLNFLEYNLGLQKNNDKIGLVTGIGLSMNNYKFDNDITLKKVNGGVAGIPIDPTDLRKTKLVVSYITVPLMLEAQFSHKSFISAGILGGLNVGSHTKIKWDNNKEKDHDSFYLNPFKCAAIAKLCIENFEIYGTYNLTPFFKENKGPELTPFSIGITLVNF